MGSRSQPHPGRVLREAMQRGTVICPGVFNALVARAAQRVGFNAIYVSGGATANASGYPDIGLFTLTEMCRTVREAADASGLPVVADADTGFGEGEIVARTIVEYERAGAAALHVEDQVFPKRCGHLAGKSLISKDDMIEKIRFMRGAPVSDDFLLIARTDARSVTNIEDAIDRANAYRDAGADMIFPEGLESEEEFARFAKASPGLLLANMTEFGRTPQIPVARFAELGYRLVIYPLSMIRLAMGHVMRGLEELKNRGTVAGVLNEMQTRAELYDLLDYEPGQPWTFPNTPHSS